MNWNIIIIDGGYGEGGGQILRTAIGLSAVTGKDVKIINIRVKRRNPGLQRQHITAVKAVSTLSDAEVKGLMLGSTTLYFKPRGLTAGNYYFDVGTAGSVTLVFQALLPTLTYLPSTTQITVHGGTDVPWSPTIDYVRGVVTPFLEKIGLKINVELIRRGHYPRGGGVVVFTVKDPPGKLNSIKIMDRGRLKWFEGVSHAARLPRHVAERQCRAAVEKILNEYPDIPVNIKIEETNNTLGSASGVALWSVCEKSVLGADSLGRRGKPAEIVGNEAAEKLIEDLSTRSVFDRYMSDMVIPLLALASGESIVTGSCLSNHVITNMYVVKKIMGVEIKYEGQFNKPFKMKIKGKGFTLKH